MTNRSCAIFLIFFRASCLLASSPFSILPKGVTRRVIPSVFDETCMPTECLRANTYKRFWGFRTCPSKWSRVLRRIKELRCSKRYNDTKLHCLYKFNFLYVRYILSYVQHICICICNIYNIYKSYDEQPLSMINLIPSIIFRCNVISLALNNKEIWHSTTFQSVIKRQEDKTAMEKYHFHSLYKDPLCSRINSRERNLNRSSRALKISKTTDTFLVGCP